MSYAKYTKSAVEGIYYGRRLRNIQRTPYNKHTNEFYHNAGFEKYTEMPCKEYTEDGEYGIYKELHKKNILTMAYNEFSNGKAVLTSTHNLCF